MQKIHLKVKIKTLSPLNIGSGTQSKTEKIGYTVRRRQISQGNLGKANNSFIPATTIKGKLKYYYGLVTEAEHKDSASCSCKICKLFGSPGYSPSKIYVDDFTLVGDEEREVRSANRIDRKRGVCVDGALFTKEAVYGTYEGEITAYVENEQEKNDITTALLMIKDIGSSKSRGFGQVDISTNRDGEEL